MKHATNFKRRMMARLRLALFALSLLTVIALFANCSTESKMESKMKSEIKKHIAETAVDPGSYEFVKLVADTVTVRKVCQRLIDMDFEHYIMTDSMPEVPDGVAEGLPVTIESFADSLKYISEFYGNTILGYIMHHRYRLKDGHGVVSIEDTNFPFDTEGKLIGIPANEEIDYSVYEHVLKKQGLL